ncbi:MAG: hypothetical protein V3V16_11875 [Melioribacteraceae bacterium]
MSSISNANQVQIKPQAPIPPPKGNVENRKPPVEPKAGTSIESTIEMLNASLRSDDNLSQKIMQYM